MSRPDEPGQSNPPEHSEAGGKEKVKNPIVEPDEPEVNPLEPDEGQDNENDVEPDLDEPENA